MSDLDKKGPKQLKVIFLTIFIDLVGFSIIFPLFPAMLNYYLPREGSDSFLGILIEFLGRITPDMGLSAQFQTSVLFGGILGSLYSLLQFIFSPIWGRLSDRYGRRPILLFTIAGTAVSYLFWVVSSSFWLLILSRFLGGVMAGNLAVGTAVVADITPKEKRSKGMAIIGVAFGLGFIVGPAIGGLSSILNLISYWPNLSKFGINPFSTPAIIAFGLAILNLIWVATRFDETLPSEKREEIAAVKTNRLASLLCIDNNSVKIATLVYFIFIFSFSGMEFTLTFLAVERLEYSPSKMMVIFLYVGFVLIFVQGYFVRKFTQKIGEKILAIIGVSSGIVAFLFLAIASSTIIFYIGLTLMGIGIGLSSPTLTSLVSLYTTDQEQGKYLGIFRAAGSFARAIGPLMAAVIFWWAGSRYSYGTGSIILIITLMIAFRLTQPEKLPDAEK